MASYPQFVYRPTLFDDPKNVSSEKENVPPPLEPLNTPTLVISEGDFIDSTDKVLGKPVKWEAHVAQQIPLPRSSSPYPDDRPGMLEQLEPETEDDIDVNDYSERPANDKRPSKPKCGPSLTVQNFCLTP